MPRYKSKPGYYYCGICGKHTEDGWVTSGSEKFWSRTAAMFSGYDDNGECPDCQKLPDSEKYFSGVFDFNQELKEE